MLEMIPKEVDLEEIEKALYQTINQTSIKTEQVSHKLEKQSRKLKKLLKKSKLNPRYLEDVDNLLRERKLWGKI